MLRRGAVSNEWVDAADSTLLFVAARKSTADVVRLLIKWDAKVR